ncbi:MAG: hypothetical protein ACTSRE_03685 [Promethearchaeota archaeon]
MSLEIAEIMEISFNILYIVTIYILVILMFVRRKNVEFSNQKQANRMLLAFFLLALGDTGHVGFRVIAYALGGLESNALLVGLGALSTAITVGIFYMLILDLWRVQFDKPFSALYIILLISGIVRLGLFFFPQNAWGSTVPPADWGLYRNIPLMIQGIGAAILLLIDSIKMKNKTYRNVALWIFVSYAFYLPVILFVRFVPMIGMLMIPKTIAYVVIAIIGLKAYFPKSSRTNN